MILPRYDGSLNKANLTLRGIGGEEAQSIVLVDVGRAHLHEPPGHAARPGDEAGHVPSDPASAISTIAPDRAEVSR